MRTILMLILYFCVVFTLISGSSYSAGDLRKIFQRELCVEGTLDSIILTKEDKTKEDTEIEGILSLASVGTEEEADKSVLSRLNELVFHNQIDHYFTLTKEEGPSHAKFFQISLTLGKESYFGEGKSLKIAKRDAAAKALENTEYEFPKIKTKTPRDVEKLTPTVLLNNLGSKLGVAVTYYLLDKDKEEILHSNIVLTEKNKDYVKRLNDSMYNDKNLKMKRNIDATKGPFRIKLKFGDHVFYTTSHSIQSGRHEVAKLALDFLSKNRDNLDIACMKEGQEKECKKDKDKLKSPISKVYEEGQKRNLDVDFEVVQESGPSHKKTFIIECKLGNFVTKGEASSKKESKRIAAANMLEKISSELEPISNEINYENLDKTKKKRRKRKDKLIKNKFDEIGMVLDNVGKSVMGFAKNIFGEEEQQHDDSEDGGGHKELSNKKQTDKFDDHTKSSQKELLELSNLLNIKVAFADFTDEDDKKHISLLSLYTNPEYTCFGEDKTEILAQEMAAKNGLDLLTKIGIYELFLEEKETPIERNTKEEIRIIMNNRIQEKNEL